VEELADLGPGAVGKLDDPGDDVLADEQEGEQDKQREPGRAEPLLGRIAEVETVEDVGGVGHCGGRLRVAWRERDAPF
jgi:hypothetical protein